MMPILESPQRIPAFHAIQKPERTVDQVLRYGTITPLGELNDAIVDIFFYIQFAVVGHVNMHEESHRILHVPLTLNLIFCDCEDSLKERLICRFFNSAIILAVDHQHYTVAKFLCVGLRTACIKPLEEVEFGLIVARSLQYLHAYPCPPDGELIAFFNGVLLVLRDTLNEFRFFPDGVVERRAVSSWKCNGSVEIIG